MSEGSESSGAKLAGPSEGWQGVHEVASPSEAALVAGFLESSGIPAQVVDKSFHQYPTSDEELTGIVVAVPVERAEEALLALAGREKAFAASPEGDERLLTDEGLRDVDSEESAKTD